MLYYAIAFFTTAIAAGLYAVSGATEGAPVIGAFLFSVFLIVGASCLLLRHLNRAKPKAKGDSS